MNCEQIAESMAVYLVGAVAPEQMTLVEDHLRDCPGCAADLAMWKKMAVLPVESPSPESRLRFEAMLHAYPTAATAIEQSGALAASADAPKHAERGLRFERGATQHARWFEWLRSPVGVLAWSAALLLFGVLIGTGIGPRMGGGNSSREREIADMHAELTGMRQMVAISMLQQQLASERLQGVTFSNREEHLDPQIFAALLHTLRYDNSVDVRLAALDALSRHAGQAQVRKSVVDSLQTQESPMVQVALIDLLSEWRDPGTAQRLRNFQQSPNLNPTVRQRAQWAVSKLQ